jgi:hypothetical protein
MNSDCNCTATYEIPKYIVYIGVGNTHGRDAREALKNEVKTELTDFTKDNNVTFVSTAGLDFGAVRIERI